MGIHGYFLLEAIEKFYNNKDGVGLSLMDKWRVWDGRNSLAVEVQNVQITSTNSQFFEFLNMVDDPQPDYGQSSMDPRLDRQQKGKSLVEKRKVQNFEDKSLSDKGLDDMLNWKEEDSKVGLPPNIDQK